MKKYSRILLIIGCLCPLLLLAKVYNMDLEKSLERAMEQSHRMRTIREDLKQAEYSLKAATHMFRTNVNMEFTLPNYTETIQRLQDSLGSYFTYQKQATYEGNVTIRQPLPTDGSLYLKTGVYTQQDFYRSKTNAKLTTRLGFEQPLESFYYNSLKADLKKARLQYESEKRRLERAQLDMEYRITNVFFQLVKARERKKISKQARKNQKEAYELALNKYKAGVIPEVQALQMEVDLGEAKNQYQTDCANERQKANNFKQLLNISLSDSVDLEYELDYESIYVDRKKAVALALQNRLEIKQKKIDQKLAKLNIKERKVRGKINGTISGYYDFQGVDENTIHPSYAELFQDTYQNLSDRPGNRGISLNISIPIWDWGVNEARVEAAKARLRKTKYALENEKVEVRKEVLATVDNLHTSLNNLKSLEKNKKVSQKSYNISRKRFENGNISSQDLAQERERFNRTHISYLNAFINYKLALADLKRQTFYNFKKNKSIY